MPLIVNFGRAVPKNYRDDVQRRMTVTSDAGRRRASGTGISGTEVHYRPKAYWQAGTKISVQGRRPAGCRWATAGTAAPTSRCDAKVGPRVVMTVDNKTKKMTVKRKDGKVIRTIPVSLGKRTTPSSSGTMVVMREASARPSSTPSTSWARRRATAPTIEYAQRLTWGGEFIHAAPWSVGTQGRRNVSHGCVNVSTGQRGLAVRPHQDRRPDHHQGHRAQARATATAGPTGT